MSAVGGLGTRRAVALMRGLICSGARVFIGLGVRFLNMSFVSTRVPPSKRAFGLTHCRRRVSKSAHASSSGHTRASREVVFRQIWAWGYALGRIRASAPSRSWAVEEVFGSAPT